MHPPPTAGTRTQSRNFLLWNRLRELRDRFDSAPLSPRYLNAALILVVFFYLLLTAAQSTRYLWHDELFTYYIAKAPSLAALWRQLPLDLNPPLVFLATRASLRVLGDNPYAVRLPAILGFLLGSLCFYKFVSNRLRPSYGILAMLVFWATPFEYFATEARPYGLIIGFFGLAMLAWQQAVKPERRASSVWLLALAVIGMMSSHVLALIYIVPFCLAELYRWYRRRRFDWAVWAALVLPSIIVFVYVPLVARYTESDFPAGTQASPAKVIGFFYRMLEPESLFFLAAVCLALLVGFRRERKGDESLSFSTLEWIFTWALCLIPVLVNLAMMRHRGIAYPRYSGPAVLVYGILFAVFIAMYTKRSRLAAATASCVLLLCIAGSNVAPVLGAVRVLRSRGAVRLSDAISSVHPELPLVTASGIHFLEMDKYADPATVSRLYYLTGRDLAIKYAHATIFEGLPDLKRSFPIRATVEPYRQFVAEHPRFLVLGLMYYPEDWLLRRLLDIHASLQYLGDYNGSQLYLVTMPGQSILSTDR